MGQNNQTGNQELSRSGQRNMKATDKTTGRKNKKKKKHVLLKIILVLFLLGCIGVLSGVALFINYAKQSPTLDYKEVNKTQSVNLYDANNELFYTAGSEKRELATAEEIPFQLKEAIISIEDKRFEEHIGVDPIRIAGAFVSNITKSGSGLQGGSTLTQQLIKLSFFSTSEKDQTLKRKAQEAWMSVELEKDKSKDEILTYYINKVYMSNGIFGMKTAAEAFYDKPLEDLTLAQSALLAGIPQSPTNFDPYKHGDAAKKRRDLVLQQMFGDEKITKDEYDNAVKEPIDEGLKPLKDMSGQNKVVDNYVKAVIEEAQEKTGQDIYKDGLDIYTNIDLKAQNYLYNLVNTNDTIYFPNDDLQVGITVLDAKTGRVISQIGSRKVADNVQLGENLATDAVRDFASAMKPVNVYAPAIDKLNYSTGKIISDTPYKYPGTNISVNNYDNAYRGNITMREALVDSRNVPAVKTIDEVGLDTVTEYQKKVNLYNKDLPVQLSSAIHTETNSLAMAGAYAPFANGGKFYKPSYINTIKFNDGTEEVYSEKGNRVIKDSTAYMITDMLKDVIKRGTGTAAAIPSIYQAGKTGTSNYDSKDLDKVIGQGVPNISFVGYTPEYVISVWIGYKKFFRAIPSSEQGIALQIYRNMMAYMMQNMNVTDWEMPDSVVRIGNQLYVKGHTENQWTAPSSTPQVVIPSSSKEPEIVSDSSSEETQSSENQESQSASAEPTPTPPSESEVKPAEPEPSEAESQAPQPPAESSQEAPE